ncbi:Vacuolar protein sorting-associated protein 37B [Homalodisca vitripennis]|nr:Vacuolar protein sorting-associated protein 37B [Homalodisca vitripennis]
MSKEANIQAFPPPFAAWFRALSKLTTLDLEFILKNDTYLDSVVRELGGSARKTLEKKTLVTQNWKMAAGNLEKKAVLEEKKQELKRLCEEAVELYNTIEDKRNKLLSNLGVTLVQSTKAVEDLDKSSETTLESFMAGNIEVEDFLDTIFSIKTKSHLVEVKKEKLQALLEKRLSLETVIGIMNLNIRDKSVSSVHTHRSGRSERSELTRALTTACSAVVLRTSTWPVPLLQYDVPKSEMGGGCNKILVYH